jgi:parallel beta-helix repeat protein
MQNNHIKTIMVLIILGFLILTCNFPLSISKPKTSYKDFDLLDNNLCSLQLIVVPDDFPKIQEAVDHATEGDTIFVRNGVYHEKIIIDKQIYLIGENRTNTIIDGNNTFNSIIYLNADNIFIKDFSIINGKNGYHNAGIRGYYNRSSDCNFTTINNCIIANNENGILCYGDNFNIANTRFENNSNGINLFFSCNNSIISNSFVNDGIILIESFKNNLRNNTVNEKPLIYLENKNDEIINKKTGQIILVNCDSILIQNQILSTINAGVIIYGSYDCTIYNNSFFNNKKGIYLFDSYYNLFYNNTFSNNCYGFYEEVSQNNEIINNSFSDNINAIYISGYNHIIERNHIINNQMGLKIWFGGENFILKNNFIDNEINAYFSNFLRGKHNIWHLNYWGKSSFFPFLINGEICLSSSELCFPWFNFDWNPAKELYDMGD